MGKTTLVLLISNLVNNIISIMGIYIIFPLFIFFLWNKVFYKENFKIFMIILLVLSGISIMVMIYCAIIGIFTDSIFTLCPIFILLLYKSVHVIFKHIFKENLLMTATLVQSDKPKLNDIWTHRLTNMFGATLSFVAPVGVTFMYFIPKRLIFEIATLFK